MRSAEAGQARTLSHYPSLSISVFDFGPSFRESEFQRVINTRCLWWGCESNVS
jgi:hypothetical protein